MPVSMPLKRYVGSSAGAKTECSRYVRSGKPEFLILECRTVTVRRVPPAIFSTLFFAVTYQRTDVARLDRIVTLPSRCYRCLHCRPLRRHRILLSLKTVPGPFRHQPNPGLGHIMAPYHLIIVPRPAHLGVQTYLHLPKKCLA